MTPEQQAAEVLAAALNNDALGFKSGGWGSNPTDQARLEALGWVMTWLRDGQAAAALAAAGVLRDPDAHEAVERVRALVERDPNIAPCERHGYGPNAAIHSNCDWCAAFGMDQEWRDDLNAAIDGDAHATGHGRDEVTG